MNLVRKNATQTYEVKGVKYTLTATAQYEQGKAVSSINGGMVRSDQKMVASFNRYSPENLNVNFTSVEVTEQADILAEINAFVSAIEADVNSNI